ncbi:MAG: hypothetical protein ACI85I_000682 [Arenicella sp.]|jgi:uncharacterized protein (DUF1684 family)
MFIGVIAVVVLIIFYSLSSEQIDEGYLKDLTEFRIDKNDRFKNNEADSPFDKVNRAEFDSLSYFSVNPYYRIQADFERLGENEVVEIPTTKDGESQKYIRYGKAKFQLEGKKHEVILLKPFDKLNLPTVFLYFRDKTSGESTYGGGRYVDVIPGKTSCIIDFNMAYNPYCAYNSYYICPIPPKENYLEVPIEAGEKVYGLKK